MQTGSVHIYDFGGFQLDTAKRLLRRMDGTPVVLLKSAPAPVAVFSSAVLRRSAPAPVPVQKLPSVRLSSENIPIPVLYRPLVRLKRALSPSAVLPPG